MPPVRVQAKSLIQAAGHMAAQIVQGKRIWRTPEQVAANRAICDACDFQDKESKRCSLCGCWKEWMTFFEAGVCKKGKW